MFVTSPPPDPTAGSAQRRVGNPYKKMTMIVPHKDCLGPGRDLPSTVSQWRFTGAELPGGSWAGSARSRTTETGPMPEWQLLASEADLQAAASVVVSCIRNLCNPQRERQRS